MTHPMVTQLHFARKEFLRCLQGVSEEDASKRILPMNSIGWIVGHLASQENTYWVYLAQQVVLFPDLREMVGYGKPASTPPLSEMLTIWHSVTTRADDFLLGLTSQNLQDTFIHKEKPLPESIGTLLYRNTYHYWFHTGEMHAIRQMLGHQNLPDFVGDMNAYFYQPE